MYLIDNLTKEIVQKYRKRSERAINGLRFAIENADGIIHLKSIDAKWKCISDCMGLVQEAGNSYYNYFIPLNDNIVFLLRISDHNNTNPALYDKHEQLGRPNKRFIAYFKKGNVFGDNSVEFLNSEHHTITYDVNAMDSKESIIQYCQDLIDLLTNGTTVFHSLPILQENNKKQYSTMNKTKKRIRLTESQLHSAIKESVKRVLKEMSQDVQEYSETIWDKEYIAEFAYVYLGAEKITRNTFVDTDYGDVRYVLLNNGKILRIFLPTFEEIDSLARALYHQVGDVYKLATRRDMPLDLGYWLDVRISED